MQKVFVCSVLCAIGSSLFGANDPFVGTWKLNVAKSKRAPSSTGKATKEETMTVQDVGDQAYITLKGTREDGTTFGRKESVSIKGGPLNVSGNRPPVGTSAVMKKLNDRTADFIYARDGKVYLTDHYTVSADGKTIRNQYKGTDAQGKLVEGLTVWDRQ